jgi:UDP-N-acetyl-D-glucosamine/UDP-N-acetyl-D-galactosamine dehydrogenase
LHTLADARIAIIGLGYVGLPLAVEFGRRLPTLGFDICPRRVAELGEAHDRTLEMTAEELQQATQLRFSCDAEALRDCNTYIVTVPTPVDASNRPDMGPLLRASEAIGAVIAPGAVVIYESTVYPGATEEVCIPAIERVSGLVYNRDFYAGYSPERINPGDKQHRLTNTIKVTAGSTPVAAAFVDALYASIVSAGTHRVESIRVAEAAKVIENTQRDINIALVNELALIFNRLDIDTEAVLRAAGTKWNFLPFRPGLVGGHCIGVDPYYLTHKAEAVGYHPQVILAGRRINDGMGTHVAESVVRLMLRKRINVVGARVLVLGLSFKENCPDLRNTKVVDIVRTLAGLNAEVDVYDPWVDADEAQAEYGIAPVAQPAGPYDAVVVAVAHRQFAALGIAAIRALCQPQAVIYDVKHLFPREAVDGRL